MISVQRRRSSKLQKRTWDRRLQAERDAETWAREKCDVIEVPGLTPRSEAVLAQFDKLPTAEKPGFLQQLAGTPEGQRVLDEAKAIAKAFDQRFGSSDPRDLKPEGLRLDPEASVNLDRIKQVARMVDRVQRAELSRQYELKRSFNRGLLGLGM